MRQRIEIETLSPHPTSSGVVLCYKENGLVKTLQLSGTQLEVMNLFKIQNFSEVAKKKVDIDYEEKDWKQNITGVYPVDERVISFSDFERLEKKVNELLNLMRKSPETKI